MNIIEYGKENQQTIMLLHGGGLSWWNYSEAAELLKDRYHVILPILDGHAGSSRCFNSIEENAEALLHYIDEHCGGQLFLIGGLSLGGQVLVEMLAQRPSFCEYAIIESACVIPSKLTNILIKPMFDMSFGLIKKKWFAKLQFKSLKIKSDLFQNYYEDTCKISKQDMIAFGRFLRDLRKEKELTQEQLAEKFGVSSRSVSRWENGNTMPELGILVELADYYEVDELADYYEVDIKEIIDGERKSEIMKKEEKDTLRKVADYAEAEKKLVVKRRCIVTFVGTLVCALSIMVGYIVFPTLSEDSFLRSNDLWLGIGIIGVVLLWGIVIRENRKYSKKDK